MKLSIAFALALALATSSASAATCAHVETGQALDPQPCSTTADYLRRYATEVTAGWVTTIVPEGTRHNAAYHNDGTVTNPPVPAPPVAPPSTVISVTDFKKRLTLSEKVAIASSSDPTVKVFWDELNTAPSVDLTDNDTVGGVDYLASLNLITIQRAAAVLAP